MTSAKEILGESARAADPAHEQGIRKLDVKSNKNGAKVSLVNGVNTLLYYESILQDSIRATITYTDSGWTTGSDAEKPDKSAMEGLPIVGQETVSLKFTDNHKQTLDMVLFVNKVTPLVEDTRTNMVQLDLASREYIWNEKVRVNKRFNGKISKHIEDILTDKNYLGPTDAYKGIEGYKKKELDIEETANEQNFIGNNKKPYYIINWLSRGAVSKDSALGDSAGYLFWETAEKFYFKSIDSLMDTETNKPKRKILYNETPSSTPTQYDYKALQYNVDNKVNVQNKLKMGAYSTRIITFDPFNTYYEVVTPNAGNQTEKPTTSQNIPGNQDKLKMAGKDGLPTLNSVFNSEEEGKEFSRTTYMVLDSGTLPSGTGEGDDQEQLDKSKKENYKPGEVLNQGIMRMNQLFALKTTITIPADFSLHAGDAIYVDVAQLEKETKGKTNKETGGNYIISDLCHFMSPKHTLTKLTLVRDSFGRKPMQRG